MSLSHDTEPCGDPNCDVCRHAHPFVLPEELVSATKEGRLVVFAGAGVSTETRTVFKWTFYEEVAMELGIDPRSGPSFPELMSKFCSQPDGRSKLLTMIKKRFDYMASFPEIYRDATRFHTELATIPFLKDIVTTNWDDLFERECGATPIVVPEDFVFWNVSGRKVFKIHGSINNLGSIVATSEDYRRCYRRLSQGVMGSTLKLMLATRVVVFVGYSFSDHDFQTVHRLLNTEMKGLLPHAYVITLDRSAAERFVSANVTPIITDGAYFMHMLKERLVADEAMLPDEQFDDLPAQYALVRAHHHRLYEAFALQTSPEILYTACYQDGLLHALELVESRRKTGYCSDPSNIFRAIHGYEQIRKDKVRTRRYDDVAYIDGYVDGLLFFLADDGLRDEAPLFYLYGHRAVIRTLDDYRRELENAKSVHKSAYAFAQKVVAKLGPNVVYHHRPFL